MPAYVVAMMSIHDPLTYREYTDRTPSTLKKYGGKFLTRGEPVTTPEHGSSSGLVCRPRLSGGDTSRSAM
jgi:uncharacterized protein (DUF1330 family)